VGRRRRTSAVESLIDETSRRYIDAGIFSWEFVRGKLRHDPVYFALLSRGDLPPAGRLLDLGCGRGILLSLLAAAREQAVRGVYPESWPTPPPDLLLHGIEGRAKIARAARLALGEGATIEVSDLCEVPLPPAAAVYLLDVLHYLPAAEQEALLDRVTAALRSGAAESGGIVVLREADAASGASFARTRGAEWLCSLARGTFRQRFHFRSDAEWRRLLEERGFAVSSVPMSQGTPYANVLIEGRLPPPDVREVGSRIPTA
jgi:SAM-dependent methyltransferase